MNKFTIAKIAMALLVVGLAVYGYFSQTKVNEITGEEQRVNMTAEQEIELGLQARPTLVEQHGGFATDSLATDSIERVGNRLIEMSIAKDSKYKFEFHLLGSTKIVNALALPGGQIFITRGLWNKLENVDQLAGVLGHEIGHVISRHAAERVAKQEFTQGLTGAAVVATFNKNNPANDKIGTAFTKVVGDLIKMKFGRRAELDSDGLAVKLMIDAGYNPHEFKDVIRILEEAADKSRPEFLDTHPSPNNRLKKIDQSIKKHGGA